MTKTNKTVWIVLFAVFFAAAFLLGAAGILYLGQSDESVRVSRIVYKADIRFAEEGLLTLEDVVYTPTSFTASVSGTLISKTEDGYSVDMTVPAQRVDFRQKSDDQWYCRLSSGNEEITLYAYRSKLVTVNDETAYGKINYLQYGSTDYMFDGEE